MLCMDCTMHSNTGHRTFTNIMWHAVHIGRPSSIPNLVTTLVDVDLWDICIQNPIHQINTIPFGGEYFCKCKHNLKPRFWLF